MNDLWRLIKATWLGLVIVLVFIALCYGAYRYGKSTEEKKTAQLAVELSRSKETLELTRGLYTKEVVKYHDLSNLFTQKGAEIDALKEQLKKTDAKLLVAEQVSLTWKKAYEAAVKAIQTEEPPEEEGGPTRKRVDFEGNLGPIKATGHTLTDPPQAFLKLEQVVPLVLTMTMAQNRDETWSTFVTSSDPNVDVKINIAGVNPLILKEKWYQRLWLEAGATFLGDPAGRLGLHYQFDRFTVGADCTAWQTGNGCGATVGYRIFK